MDEDMLASHAGERGARTRSEAQARSSEPDARHRGGTRAARELGPRPFSFGRALGANVCPKRQREQVPKSSGAGIPRSHVAIPQGAATWQAEHVKRRPTRMGSHVSCQEVVRANPVNAKSTKGRNETHEQTS